MMKAPRSILALVIAVGVCAGCSSTARREAEMVGVTSLRNLEGKWAPYSDYLRSALGRVQRQWESAMIESRSPLPAVGTVVEVVFSITPDGKVARIEDVKTTPEGNGGKLCVAAITKARTFDPWTEDMKRMLGAEERMTFDFHFEDPPAKKPNQAPEPTATLVTPRAGARVAPSAAVAHL